MDENTAPNLRLTDLTSDIVSAYVSKNSVPPGELPSLIASVHGALSRVNEPQQEASPQREPPMPWKKAIKPDHIISFEDGRPYKSLKRHLSTRGLTPEQYREKWGLPPSFPMVAPNYSAARSELAKKLGLGQARKGAKKSAEKRSAPKRRKAVG
jgi:predicted transcriptional regulator